MRQNFNMQNLQLLHYFYSTISKCKVNQRQVSRFTISTWQSQSQSLSLAEQLTLQLAVGPNSCFCYIQRQTTWNAFLSKNNRKSRWKKRNKMKRRTFCHDIFSIFCVVIRHFFLSNGNKAVRSVRLSTSVLFNSNSDTHYSSEIHCLGTPKCLAFKCKRHHFVPVASH